jgi:hypothetical protein
MAKFPPPEFWKTLPRWVQLLAVSVDRYLNWKLGGSRDETISYRAAKDRDAGGRSGTALCAILDRYDPGHCDKALRNPDGE